MYSSDKVCGYSVLLLCLRGIKISKDAKYEFVCIPGMVGVICRMQNAPYLFFDIWMCEEGWGMGQGGRGWGIDKHGGMTMIACLMRAVNDSCSLKYLFWHFSARKHKIAYKIIEEVLHMLQTFIQDFSLLLFLGNFLSSSAVCGQSWAFFSPPPYLSLCSHVAT